MVSTTHKNVGLGHCLFLGLPTLTECNEQKQTFLVRLVGVADELR